MATELLNIAVRVLQATVDYQPPPRYAIQILRDAAPDHAAGPVDELARYIIERELSSGSERPQSRAAGA